ncbi:ABC transporter ATP-binding protein [Desulfobulbus rhabdoformis]|jgi:cobalt/nickel transport system ATP-binding protein|uniref:energy-coupling factor ABC transporter ATP-binding protein n=1 Tax=Desulfobulbus rhabdoformis TaxID=34032 RepID=UPI001962AC60|nr:ABC transporter ATP-binding protein [Desulfobulbus rhabdoformis]MBM9615689.1 ABC transporter ATP-binding protein [Desulfobulbus rhabdoformis]
MSHHIVEVQDLSYTYADGTKAVDGISFRIHHGESVAVVGANGAGKSTLLLHLNGYLTPQNGKVRIGDFPLTRKTIKNIRKTVGMVFQNSDDQLFMPTVYDDVAFGPLNLGLAVEEVEERVIEALSRTNSEHLKDRPPYKLSGGEKRAVAIATVLAMSPDILVMDEPTSNLDPRARRSLIDLLSGFHHTKIIATHDLDMVLDLCERTIVILEGKIMADGPTVEIFQNTALLATCHLEKPLRMQPSPVIGPKVQ